MLFDAEMMRQFDEANTLVGQMMGRAYRTMLAAAVSEGMPDSLAQQVVGPYVVKQMLAAADGVAQSDPERGFLDWLRSQMDGEE